MRVTLELNSFLCLDEAFSYIFNSTHVDIIFVYNKFLDLKSDSPKLDDISHLHSRVVDFAWSIALVPYYSPYSIYMSLKFIILRRLSMVKPILSLFVN